MFEIELNNNIKASLSQIEKQQNLKDFHHEVHMILEKGSISMNTLCDFYDRFWKSKIQLKELLSPLNFDYGAEYVPGSGYSPEFKKQLEKLKIQQQEDEYQTLIQKRSLNDKKIASNDQDDEITFSSLNKVIREQITTVFNVLVSVISVVVAVWYWTDSSTSFNLQYRVLTCVFFGILVLVAEVVVYNSYLTKIREAKIKERNKKEVKKVIREIII